MSRPATLDVAKRRLVLIEGGPGPFLVIVGYEREPLRAHSGLVLVSPVSVASGRARLVAGLDGIVRRPEDDRDRLCRLLCRLDISRAGQQKEIDPEPHQLSRKPRVKLVSAVR